MNIIGRFISPQKLQALSEAYDATSGIMSMASSPQDALIKAGITNSDLDKIKKMLNNPLAGVILKPLGLDVNQTRQMLDNITLTYDSSSKTTQGDELEALQKSLAQLK